MDVEPANSLWPWTVEDDSSHQLDNKLLASACFCLLPTSSLDGPRPGSASLYTGFQLSSKTSRTLTFTTSHYVTLCHNMLEYLTMANKSKPSRVPSGARNAVLEKLSAASATSEASKSGSGWVPAQKDMEICGSTHTQTISKRFEEHYISLHAYRLPHDTWGIYIELL